VAGEDLLDARELGPLGETLEVWRMRVTNNRPQPAELSLFSSVEWALWNASDDAENSIRELAALAETRHGSASLDLPGGRAVREYAVLRIESGSASPSVHADEAPLVAGSPVRWGGWVFTLGSQTRGTFRVPAPAGALVVRSRRPGDRLAGRLRIKVQDLFTDAKVPVRARATHPLVATASGAVWWVVGLRHADGAADPGRWIAATPPPAQIEALRRYTGNIDRGDRPTAD